MLTVLSELRHHCLLELKGSPEMQVQLSLFYRCEKQVPGKVFCADSMVCAGPGSWFVVEQGQKFILVNTSPICLSVHCSSWDFQCFEFFITRIVCHLQKKNTNHILEFQRDLVGGCS